MTQATESSPSISAPGWSTVGLGYPVASVVVRVARGPIDRDTTGPDEDRARR
jgi:hypothetical protein